MHQLAKEEAPRKNPSKRSTCMETLWPRHTEGNAVFKGKESNRAGRQAGSEVGRGREDPPRASPRWEGPGSGLLHMFPWDSCLWG